MTEAESLQLEALAIERRSLGNENPTVATTLDNLAVIYVKQGKFGPAESLLLEALKIRQSGNATDPQKIRRALTALSGFYAGWAKLDSTKAVTAVEWKQKLQAFDQAEAAKKTATP